MLRTRLVSDRSTPGNPVQHDGGHWSIRCLDVIGATVGLCVSAPALAALALAVKLTSPGPSFFTSTRVGLHGRSFTLFKLRSMCVEADVGAAAITVADDARVTPLGRFMRKWKLDELPQFFNVLRGDMGLVGPRPESPRYVTMYSREQLNLLEVKPGLTSPASLRYRDESSELTGEDWEERYIKDIMPAKLAIDLDYIRKRTVWTDLVVILQTVRALTCGSNAEATENPVSTEEQDDEL